MFIKHSLILSHFLNLSKNKSTYLLKAMGQTMLAPSPMIPPLNRHTRPFIKSGKKSISGDGTRDPKSFPCSDFLDWKQDQNYTPFSTVKNTAFEAALKWLYDGVLSVKQTFPRLSPTQTTTCTQEGSVFFISLKRFGQKLQNRWNILNGGLFIFWDARWKRKFMKIFQ